MDAASQAAGRSVLLLGSGGQLGHELAPLLRCFALAHCPSRDALDIRDTPRVRAALERLRPSVVVNATAYNAVDLAESGAEAAMAVNCRAVGDLAEAAASVGCAVVHFSTDFVFDGLQGRPYVESDRAHPLNRYGESKLAGEAALLASRADALVFRTSWVYSLRRKSFVSAILAAARREGPLQVVADQTGSPTFARDLAAAVAIVLARVSEPHALRSLRGVYHLAGSGQCSRFDLAKAAIAMDPHKHEHRFSELVPTQTVLRDGVAARPTFSPLDCTKAMQVLGVSLPDWHDGLKRALGDTATHYHPATPPRAGRG